MHIEGKSVSTHNSGLETRQFETRDQIAFGEDSIAIELLEHNRLQSQFDAALGRSYDAKDMLQRSYNPVSDRWRIEKLRRQGDNAAEEAYVKEMLTNIKTNLKERLQVAENVITYRIEGDELYSEHFPQESFGHILQRGAEYRLKHGTQEAVREGLPGERGGWEVLRKKFTDPETPVGTKMTVLSPPGVVKDSAYDRQIVDEYELVQGQEGKYMKLTRRIVDFDEKDYLKAAFELDPSFFDGYDDRPLDAWYLSHPKEGTLPDLKQRINGMSAAVFKKIYDSTMLQGMIENYIEDIRKQRVNWRQIALDINAILNQVDKEENAVLHDAQEVRPIYISKETVRAAVNILGWQKPQERGGAGCPTSKGYIMSNGSIDAFYTGSVAQFAIGGGGAQEWFTCPECHYKASGPVGDQCPGCGLTKEAYAEKSGQEICE